jgi:hypothetical protein
MKMRHIGWILLLLLIAAILAGVVQIRRLARERASRPAPPGPLRFIVTRSSSGSGDPVGPIWLSKYPRPWRPVCFPTTTTGATP